MGFKDTIDIFGGGNRDKSGGLFNVDSIVVVNKSHVSKGWLVLARESETFANNLIDGFGNILIRAGKSKVIDLAKQEDFGAAERG